MLFYFVIVIATVALSSIHVVQPDGNASNLYYHQTQWALDWIEQCFTSPPTQCMGDGFYRSKDPTNSIKVVKEKATKEKQG